MREPEFLPAWYPQLRRRKRRVILQAWATIALLVAICAWTMVAERRVRGAEVDLVRLDTDLSTSRVELRELDMLLLLERQLNQQEKILGQVGMQVEAARMLVTLDELMPTEMSLLDLDFLTEEKTKPAPVETLEGVRAAQEKEKNAQRWMKIRLVGVAPSDVELATFLAKLSSKPFFAHVSMQYAKDRPDTSGHLMREFEVHFEMNLSEGATD